MTAIAAADVHKIVLACEAGMGSSALVVSQLKKQLAGLPVVVEHTAVGRIPPDADLIICHRSLAERARQASGGRPVVPFDTFIGDPAFGRIADALRAGAAIEV
jgi:mannitol-specific phosphotransferase system IIBC component